MIDTCGRVRKINLACELSDQRIIKRIRPDDYKLITLITVCGRCEDVARGFTVPRETTQEGFRPDEVAYNTLIDSHVEKRGV